MPRIIAVTDSKQAFHRGIFMKRYLLPDKNAYKANLHIHSNFSDGKMTPEEIKAHYVANRYSIVAFTDHEAITTHNELRDEKFLPLTSYELAINDTTDEKIDVRKRTYHLNFFARDPECTFSSAFSYSRMYWERGRACLPKDKIGYECPGKEYSVECINRLVAEAREEGFIVSYNHPVWSQQSYPDYIDLKGLFGIEVHNTECKSLGYHDTVQPWCDLLGQGERLFPLATDDAHSIDSTLGGWIYVMADKLEYGTVFEALEHGDFYASNGPEIKELYLEDGILAVKTSPAVKVEINTERRAAMSSEYCNIPCEEFKFDLTKFLQSEEGGEKAPYFRVTVRDEKGNCAWSRAYFLNELRK